MSGNFLDRQNWTRSLTVVMIFAVIAVAIGYLVNVEAVVKDRVYLQNTAGAVLFDHEMHSQVTDSCVECHHTITADAEATSCRDCHSDTQPSKNQPVNCESCHDDSYSPEMMVHDEYLEIDEHTCLGCHSPRSVSDAYHTNCTTCHLETSRERFTKVDGDVLCGACHLR